MTISGTGFTLTILLSSKLRFNSDDLVVACEPDPVSEVAGVLGSGAATCGGCTEGVTVAVLGVIGKSPIGAVSNGICAVHGEDDDELLGPIREVGMIVAEAEPREGMRGPLCAGVSVHQAHQEEDRHCPLSSVQVLPLLPEAVLDH